MKSGPANLFGRGGRNRSSKFERKFYEYEQPIVSNVLESDVTTCPYGVLAKDVARISLKYIFLSKTFLMQNQDYKSRDKKKKKMFWKKEIGLKFFMEDWRASAINLQNSISQSEC